MVNSRKRKKEEIPAEDWLEYKATPTKEFQNRIIQRYGYIPRTIAYEYAHKKPYMLEVEDLIQAGMVGLFQAMDRYDPNSGVQFNTFATFRIRGSIIDQINAVDWTPRPVRERIKQVLATIESIKGEFVGGEENIEVDAQSISDRLQEHKKEKYRLNVDEVEVVLQQLKKTYISHMEPEVMNSIEDNDGGMSDVDSIATIMNMVLDMNERMVIELKYFGGYRNKEIVEKTGLKLAQLHLIEQEALAKLARNLPNNQN